MMCVLVVLCSFDYVLVLFTSVLFLFFFFFKQKTAYEMRISDWSSDVCSSDLAHSCQHELRKIVRETACGSGEGPENRTDRDQSKQIGRASCRERVCQYV